MKNRYNDIGKICSFAGFVQVYCFFFNTVTNKIMREPITVIARAGKTKTVLTISPKTPLAGVGGITNAKHRKMAAMIAFTTPEKTENL